MVSEDQDVQVLWAASSRAPYLPSPYAREHLPVLEAPLDPVASYQALARKFM